MERYIQITIYIDLYRKRHIPFYRVKSVNKVIHSNFDKYFIHNIGCICTIIDTLNTVFVALLYLSYTLLKASCDFEIYVGWFSCIFISMVIWFGL